ncbi:MAG: hypothetical protein O3C27_10255 [Actinomycetota bacterium]|nr:hypothetical protein [Actinomycetota bacterium]
MTTADSVMLRVLRLPEDLPSTGGADVAQQTAEARSAFQTSIFISSIRCLLTYIILPFVAPTFAFLGQVAKPVGVAVALVAMVSIVASMRKFWRVRHRQRWAYTTLGGAMFCFLVFSLAIDLL